jgi:D-xylose transport system substrate-binding protein
MIAVAAIATGCSPATASPSARPSPTAVATISLPTPTPTPAPLTPDSFNASFSAMAVLRPFATTGGGVVDVILPDLTTSARYAALDTPALTHAFTAAGYLSSEFNVQNASGTINTQVAIAQADIAAGARVLVVDPIDAATGKKIQTLAQAAAIPVIGYDHAILQGTSTYFVGFNNEDIGKVIGRGFLSCVKSWAVSSPKVFTLDADPTDQSAIDWAKGYNSVVWGQEVAQVPSGTTNDAGMTLVGEEVVPGSFGATGGTIFDLARSFRPEINATIEANDGLAGGVITELRAAGVPAKHVPTVGQDASLIGAESILEGYQCGSVYKPAYLEAQAAVAVATYLRVGAVPPSTLVDGSTSDPSNASITEPAVFVTPVWVTEANLESTVIADGAVKLADLCDEVGAFICAADGIK